MSGTPLEQFTTLMASQGPAWASGPEAIINEAVKRRYTITRIQAGKSMDEMVQGGTSIKDTIFLEEKTTYQRYNPNVKIAQVDNPQTGVQWEVPWSFATAYMSWTKQELGLNKETTGRFRAQRYKSVMFQKHQNLLTDICNKQEEELWAQPNYTEMESATPVGPRQPYPITAFITEGGDGVLGVPVSADGVPWLTLQQIAQATPANAKWRCQHEAYTFDGGSTGTAATAATIFAPMSRLMHKLRFDKLPRHGQYSDKATSPHVILCSLNGLANYEHALRVNQDFFRGIGKTTGQDPDYDGPTFRNVPLEYISSLDTAAVYPNAFDTTTSLVAEGSVSTAASHAAGPRYYFVNGEYLNFVWHSENYMVLETPVQMTAGGQPFTWVQYADLWNNLIARSLYRQGLLYPSTPIVNAA